jgi:hypothetical protein
MISTVNKKSNFSCAETSNHRPERLLRSGGARFRLLSPAAFKDKADLLFQKAVPENISAARFYEAREIASFSRGGCNP